MDRRTEFEVLLLGTGPLISSLSPREPSSTSSSAGTSSQVRDHRPSDDERSLTCGAQVPVISCLTAPQGQGCACCLSTLRPEGRRNLRRNTSALVKVHKGLAPGERPKTILIDVGKSFCEAARAHFPANGVRELDAVLLTHPQ